jgi:hypothetical protein
MLIFKVVIRGDKAFIRLSLPELYKSPLSHGSEGMLKKTVVKEEGI